jgi:glycosyltransferase involved in cell wall biosynthesis
MIKAMIDGLGRLDYIHVPLRFSREVDEHGRFAFAKLLHLVAVTFRLASLLILHRQAVLYFPAPPPKLGTVLRDWIILSLCRPLAGKTIFHFHAYGLGEFLERHFRFARLAGAFKAPDVAVVLGRMSRKDAELLSAGRICEIPYGIDVQAAASAAKHDGPIRILFVGLHIPSKGIGDVLETARVLKDRGLDVEIHTVGPWRDESIRCAMEERRRALGLEAVVQFRGELLGDDLWRTYAESDVFFFPTFFEFETFGVVVLEAMANGLPVVASNWRGPGDLVEDDETGFLCETRDINAYADALSKLVTDAALRERMGRRARERYAERYTAERYARDMCSVFESLSVDRLNG